MNGYVCHRCWHAKWRVSKHGGLAWRKGQNEWELRRKRQKEKRRRDKSIKKKVAETEEKRMSHRKKAHLRGTSSWAAFQQTRQKSFHYCVLKEDSPPQPLSSLSVGFFITVAPVCGGGGRPPADWDPSLLQRKGEGSHLSALTPLEGDRWRQASLHLRGEDGGKRGRRSRVEVGWGCTSGRALAPWLRFTSVFAWMLLYLCFDICVCVCLSVCIHACTSGSLHTSHTGRWVCVLCFRLCVAHHSYSAGCVIGCDHCMKHWQQWQTVFKMS